MVDLSTSYMGIPLNNPLIVSSSGMTGHLEGVEKCAAAGAGAIVLKSLFEEQIAAETDLLSSADISERTEAYEYLQGYGMELGPQDYLQLVKDAKKSVDIPIIASLNCISSARWANYATKLESAGADAIELNVGLMPTRAKQAGPEVLEQYFKILHDVKFRVKIPVAMKVGPYFTSFANFADRLSHDRAEAPPFAAGRRGMTREEGKISWQGVDGLVLFNRFYKFDIDIDKLELVHGNPFSTPAEIHYTLRWLSLLAGKVDCDLAGNTGIHDGRDVIKAILAGAKVVQVCSTLYQNGLEQLSIMQEQIQAWMREHDHSKLCEFRGLLSQARSKHPEHHERLQYIKLFSDIV